MLIRFDSKVGGFSMLDDSAVPLLKAMGLSGTVPSAILAQDIPPALARLKAVVAAAPAPAADAGDGGGKRSEDQVSLSRRAFPLIDLLERAARAKADVLWDRE